MRRPPHGKSLAPREAFFVSISHFPFGETFATLRPHSLSAYAVVAELVDALRSGRSEGNLVEVQVFSTAQLH